LAQRSFNDSFCLAFLNSGLFRQRRGKIIACGPLNVCAVLNAS
jgi:hypothetical protein